MTIQVLAMSWNGSGLHFVQSDVQSDCSVIYLDIQSTFAADVNVTYIEFENF